MLIPQCHSENIWNSTLSITLSAQDTFSKVTNYSQPTILADQGLEKSSWEEILNTSVPNHFREQRFAAWMCMLPLLFLFPPPPPPHLGVSAARVIGHRDRSALVALYNSSQTVY